MRIVDEIISWVRFCGLCIADAWRGSLTIANAWAGLLGVIIVAAAAKYFWQLELKLPETVQDAIGFSVLTLLATWIVVFTTRLIGAPSRLYWAERKKVEAHSLAKTQFFIIDKNIYCESRSIIWAGSSNASGFYENVFYLVVGNALDTGRLLKRAQARIFHFGEPTLARVKETNNSEIDIRHGELALFEIGKIISTDLLGLIQRTVDLDENAKNLYTHNSSIGALSFEVYSAAGKREYGLAYRKDLPAIWELSVVVSADEARALSVRVNVDLSNHKSPVSCEVGA